MSLEFATNLNFGDSYILLDFGAPLEGSELSCLLCNTTTQLIGFDPKILQDKVRELNNLISEITSLDPEIILPGDEDSATFCCPSCVTKLQVLRETYESTAKLQHQLRCLSTAIAYQLLKKQLNRQYEDVTVPVHSTADTEIEWNEQFHEWNERRLESQVLESHLQSEALLDIGQQILADIHREESNQMVNLNCQVPEPEQVNEAINPEHEAFRRFRFQPNNYDNAGDATVAAASSFDGVSEQTLAPENVEASVTAYTYTVTEEPGGGPERDNCIDCMNMKETEDTLETDDNDNSSDMEVQHSRLEFPCTQCSRLFVTEEGLNEHVRRKHGPAKRYPCSFCKKVYVQEHSLIYHTNTIHGTQERQKDESRACPYCDKTLSTRYYMLCHVFKHRKEFPNKQFPCKTCKKDFDSVELLLAHLTIHRGKFNCTKSSCLKRFATSFDLRQHLAIHEKASKIFSCDFCWRSFITQSELEVHVVANHETLFNPAITCEVCNESFPTQVVLNTHMKSHVPKVYNCEFCDKSYHTRFEFKTHQAEAHKTDKLYPCDECDATFKTKFLLDEHLKRHPKFKFKCDHCTSEAGVPKRFARVSDYWSHMGMKHPGVAAPARSIDKPTVASTSTSTAREREQGPWRLSAAPVRSSSPTAGTSPSPSASSNSNANA